MISTKEMAAIDNLKELYNRKDIPALDMLAEIDNSIEGFLSSLGYPDLANIYALISVELFDKLYEKEK